jgi:YfiH family protein
VPLLFYDPRRPAVGVAHAGWRGTVAGMAEATVRAFVENFGTQPSDLRVVIGPSIGPCCYEIGPEVIAAVQERLPTAPALLSRRDGKAAYFDLWKANRDLLVQAGVLDDHIEVSGLCTAHHADTFFSHRATGGATGRFAAVIGLRPRGSGGGHTADGQ